MRLADADLVIKVIDACNSGTLLVKRDAGFAAQQKSGFKNLIQISSCLDSQNSLTGDPLSIFTEKFCASVLRKPEGIVYYTDIISALRDEYIQNVEQTPFFVSQGTGREQFVDDAKCFDALRAKLASMTMIAPALVEEQQLSDEPATLRSLLQNAEENTANPEQVSSFVDNLFDSLINQLSNNEFSEFFELNFIEHSDFKESTTKAFTVRILSQEYRSDDFVVATITREDERDFLYSSSSIAMLGALGPSRAQLERFNLELNYSMKRVQIKIELTPKYNSLRQINLVVTCAPSLEHCYIFEIGTQHALRDFGKFSAKGDEVVRRWYKLRWSDITAGVIAKVVEKLEGIVREHLKATEQRLSKEKS